MENKSIEERKMILRVQIRALQDMLDMRDEINSSFLENYHQLHIKRAELFTLEKIKVACNSPAHDKSYVHDTGSHGRY